jgi:hypothetical protein
LFAPPAHTTHDAGVRFASSTSEGDNKWRRRQIYAPRQVVSAQPRQAVIIAAIIAPSMKMISKPAAAADILNVK